MLGGALRWLVFWATVARETAGRRRLARAVEGRLGARRVEVQGLDAVPGRGPFIVAVNHHRAGGTLELLAAVLRAVAGARPDVLEDALLIVGHRAPPSTRLLTRLARSLAAGFFGRWGRHVLRIPMDEGAVDLAALRAFQRRAARQPVLVFPEGRAGVTFGGIRAGAGRWLAALPAPTLPVAAWPDEDGGFHVVVGAAVDWARRGELRDLQLGLAIAALLPPALAPEWQEALAGWRAAHASPEAAVGLTERRAP